MSEQSIIAKHIVQEVKNGQRLQEYGVGIFLQISTKSALKKAIKKKQIKVNNKLASTAHFVQKGDVITLLDINDKPKKEYRLKLNVIFEDDFLAVIVKPAGISVSGNKFATIANALSQNIKCSNQLDATIPHPVHRLDYETAGLLVVGKTIKSKQLLHSMFQNHEIRKTYHAVCVREFESPCGTISEPLEGKEAITHYKVLQTEISDKYEALNLVELTLETGRTHQLRRHMLLLGNPIMGDKKYYLDGFQHKGYGLYLFSSGLAFNHPINHNEIILNIDLPKKFKRIFNLK